MTKQLTLYLKHIPLIKFSIDSAVDFEIYEENSHLLPYPLRTHPNLSTLKGWLSSRAIPTDRENAKRLFNEIGIPQSRPIAAVLKCHALSLNDSYWIQLNATETWEMVNLYHNSFSDTLRDIALTGHSSKSVIEGDLRTPEITTQGTYAKCWNRLDDGIYLYKTNYDSRESEAEYISSHIADRLGFNHVHYDLVEYQNRLCCKCKNICTEDLSIISMDDYLSYKQAKPTSLVDWLVLLDRSWHQDFLQMLLFDGLVGNQDRHLKNWGLLMNANTTELLGLHPLFDHNCAVDIRDKDFSIHKHSSMSNNTYIQAAQYAYKHLPTEVIGKVQRLQEWYNTKEAKQLFRSIYKRLDELEYLKQLAEHVTGQTIKKQSFFKILGF